MVVFRSMNWSIFSMECIPVSTGVFPPEQGLKTLSLPNDSKESFLLQLALRVESESNAPTRALRLVFSFLAQRCQIAFELIFGISQMFTCFCSILCWQCLTPHSFYCNYSCSIQICIMTIPTFYT